MPRVALRVHRGRKAFAQYQVVLDEMTRTHEDVIKAEFIKKFDNIVANWSNKPSFKARKMLGADDYRLYVYAAGSEKAKQIWTYNVEGTKPHPIEAKNAPRLAFMWGGKGSYIPKTGPGGKWFGGPGTVLNGTFRGPAAVMHPGTAPRNWPQVVAEDLKGFYSRNVENAWRRALRRINR